MSARDDILGRIRTALGPDRAEPTPIPRDYRTTDDRSPAELLDVLTDRLEDYKATVVRCGPAEVAL
jgi:L-lactate dehydrogenase complex protein LldG